MTFTYQIFTYNFSTQLLKSNISYHLLVTKIHDFSSNFKNFDLKLLKSRKSTGIFFGKNSNLRSINVVDEYSECLGVDAVDIDSVAVPLREPWKQGCANLP